MQRIQLYSLTDMRGVKRNGDRCVERTLYLLNSLPAQQRLPKHGWRKIVKKQQELRPGPDAAPTLPIGWHYRL